MSEHHPRPFSTTTRQTSSTTLTETKLMMCWPTTPIESNKSMSSTANMTIKAISHHANNLLWSREWLSKRERHGSVFTMTSLSIETEMNFPVQKRTLQMPHQLRTTTYMPMSVQRKNSLNCLEIGRSKTSSSAKSQTQLLSTFLTRTRSPLMRMATELST